MADVTGSSSSAWGGLKDFLVDAGMGVLEAGGERLKEEILNKDQLPPTPIPSVGVTEYQGPVLQTGTANANGSLMGVQFNPILLYGSLGLLAVALVIKAVR